MNPRKNVDDSIVYGRVSYRGFTLIEILIVVFIISVVTTVSLLSISRNENKQLESFANELTQIMTLAEEQALLQPSILGLRVNKDFFYFSKYETTATDKKMMWSPLDDAIFGKHFIPDDIEVKLTLSGHSLSIEEEKELNLPQIIISTSGDITPFSIYIGKKGKKPRYLITGEADGNITNKVLT